MQRVGYASLAERLELHTFPLKREARVMPTTRIHLTGDMLAVPASLAPAQDDTLGHLLFALKHEGIHLSLLAQIMPHVPAEALAAAFEATPSGIYIRKACFLWEAFNEAALATTSRARGNMEPLFNPGQYITGPARKHSRWRIAFNGMGTLQYCATIERSANIETLLDQNILQRAQEFMDALPEAMVDRAIQWAYLHETRSSFAIEKEVPGPDKAQRFMRLLRQAHDGQPLTENYLVALQNSTISNPHDQAAAFRHEQNHLSNGRGAAGVTYVPPPPTLCHELMSELMQFANEAPRQINPLIAAGIIAFGFVFLHPFMDGNGRLSRFLIHQALCRAGTLKNGLLLPVSIAMQRNEARYLAVLQSYSRPMRAFWEVGWLDADALTFDFKGHPALYRYWDATSCVEFTLEMARQALEIELREETAFLARHDHIVQTVNAKHDIRGSDLSKLVIMCLDNDGKLSQNRRRQFQYQVPEEALNYIEEVTQQTMRNTP